MRPRTYAPTDAQTGQEYYRWEGMGDAPVALTRRVGLVVRVD